MPMPAPRVAVPVLLSLGLALALGGCRRAAAPAGTPAAAPPVAAPAAADALRALADRIDPGEVPSLHEGVPAWAVPKFGLDQPVRDAKALLDALAAWRTMPSNTPSQQRLGAAVQLAMAALAVERSNPDTADPQLMVALARLYGTFDAPLLFDRRGLFGSMLRVAAQALAQRPEGGTDERQAAELLEWVPAALSRLPALHRRMVARLLREAPERPELPDLLDQLATTEPPEAGTQVALRQQSIRLRGRFATAAHHRYLAWACFTALDLGCGDAALGQARRLTEPNDVEGQRGLTETEQHGAKARRIVALGQPKTHDDALARAALLVELGRTRDAQEAYAAARKAQPRDARALAGEIGAQLGTDLDFDRAFATLEGAGEPLEHREAAFLELAIGVRSVHLMYTVLPSLAAETPQSAVLKVLPALVPVRRDIAELAALGAEKGLVMAFLLALGDELLPSVRDGDVAAMMKVGRGLLPRTLELRRAVPSSRYAYELMLAAVQFSADRSAALAAVAAAPPVADDTSLANRAAMTRLALALTFDARGELDAVEQQIARWPDSFPAQVRTRALARVDAVRWRMTGELASRDRALGRYETVLVPSSDAADVTDLCNFAVLLADAGRTADAEAALAHAATLEGTNELLRLHRAVFTTPIDLAALEALASGAEAQIGLAALDWLVAVDTRPKARAKWQAQRAKAKKAPMLRAVVLPTARGLGVGSTLQVGVGYSTTKGLELNLDSGPTPRLYVVPPARGR